MTLAELFEPFVLFIAWSRNTYFNLGEFRICFMDFWVFQLFAGIIIFHVIKIFNM